MSRTTWRRTGVGLVLVAFIGSSPDARGQDLEMSFADGRVTLLARNVSLPVLLDTWSAVGGTEFVDTEDLPRQPLHLQLVDTPEPQALRIILREAAGYVAAPRPPQPGRSGFRRVIVMARSGRAASAPAFVPTGAGGASRSRLSPVQRGPRVVGGGLTDELGVTEDEAIESLRELLPQPASPFDRGARDAGVGQPMPTAPRPGMAVETTDDTVPAFIRPVAPQDDDR